jgi:acyl transferase domain-containing protein
MAAGLVESCPVFAARLAQCAAVLDPLTGWPLLDTVCGRGGSLERVEVVQPALWAVMVSLAAVWQAAGITPDAVVGHSQGEIAAAVVAGVLSLADGAKVVALRSRALAELAGTGGMTSLAEPAEAVQHRLEQWDGRVHIAAVNGPRQVVVSGDAQALDELAAACEGDGVRARRVEVDYASHSPRIDPIRRRVEDALASVTALPGTVTVVSGVDGQVIDGAVMDGGYWYRSLREPVQFHRAVQTLAASGHRIFVEVSPHPVLTTAVEDVSTSSSSGAGAGAGAGTGGVVVTGTLRRDDGGLGRLASSLARVWVAGGGVDWSRWFPGPQHRVDLPTYAFQRRRYWPGRPAVGGDPAGLGLVGVGHPLLGAAVELPGTGGVVLTGRLSLATHPWLADHQVAGTVLLPGAAFAELAVRAADEAGCGLVEELVLQAPLVLPVRGGVQVRVSVSGPSDDGRRTVEVHSRRDDAGAGEPWTLHAAGTLTAGPAPLPSFDLTAWPPPGGEAVEANSVYEALAGRGLAYGPAFRGLVAAWGRSVRRGQVARRHTCRRLRAAPGIAGCGPASGRAGIVPGCRRRGWADAALCVERGSAARGRGFNASGAHFRGEFRRHLGPSG